LWSNLLDINAINENSTLLEWLGTNDSTQQGGFATTIATNKRSGGATCEGGGYVFEQKVLSVISDGYVVEVNHIFSGL
jgi:hypothetical protein